MGKKLSPRVISLVCELMRQGHSPTQSARMVGISRTMAYVYYQQAGGVFRPVGNQYAGRYLSVDERYEIARLLETGASIRQIGARLGRAASSISRELTRNRDPRTGTYIPAVADRLAWGRQRRPKPSKLATHPALRALVQDLLDRRYSPEQVAGRLGLENGGQDRSMTISHETIYRSLFVYPRGELKRELQAHLRRGATHRTPRGRAERPKKGDIAGAVSIHDRPAEIEERLIPGHHEGDLILGDKASNSAVGTIVERASGYLTLIHLPEGHGADDVVAGITEQMAHYPDQAVRSITWDRGAEMHHHADLTQATGIKVYFADPYAPWQRGSNENTNGLLREYLPKSTDLSTYSRAALEAIANELNDRPRKRLGYYTPREVFAKLLGEDPTVATTV